MIQKMETNGHGSFDTHLLFKHRFAHDLLKAKRLGRRHFVMEGPISDWFYNLHFGTRTFVESLVTQLLFNVDFEVSKVFTIFSPRNINSRQVCVTKFHRPQFGGELEATWEEKHFPSLRQALFPGSQNVVDGLDQQINDEALASSENDTHASLPSTSTYMTQITQFASLLDRYTNDDTAFIFMDFFSESGMYPNLGSEVNEFAKIA